MGCRGEGRHRKPCVVEELWLIFKINKNFINCRGNILHSNNIVKYNKEKFHVQVNVCLPMAEHLSQSKQIDESLQVINLLLKRSQENEHFRIMKKQEIMIYTTVVDIYVDMNIKTFRTWSSKLDIEIEQIPKTCGFEFRIGARWILSVKPRTEKTICED